MPEQAGAAGEQWFVRGERVRFGERIGVVQSSFLNGIHYVYVECEHRIMAVPGDMLTRVEPAERPSRPT